MFKNRRLATFLFLIHHTELGAWIPDHLWLRVRSRACLREPGEEAFCMNSWERGMRMDMTIVRARMSADGRQAIVFSYIPIQNRYFLLTALLP